MLSQQAIREQLTETELLSEQTINEQLTKIKQLKEKIATRLWDTAETVIDEKGRELSSLNIQNRIAELADEIIAAYPDQCPVLVGVLVGGVPFASKLFEELNAKGYSFDEAYMQTSSYHGGMSSGNLTVDSLPKIPLGNRVVIVIDDVCDTGKTYAKIKSLFEEEGAAAVKLMTLVDKKQDRVANSNPGFTGFVVSKDKFIIGFGLDFADKLRSKREIKAVNTQYLPTPEEQAILDKEKPLNEILKEIRASNRSKVSLGTSRDTMFTSLHELRLPLVTPQPPASLKLFPS